MNRLQEYNHLMQALESVPSEMTQMSNQTISRARRRRIIRRSVTPPAIFIAVLLSIALAVNLSPAAAYAAERIPGLRQIAAAVSFNPSLKVAVAHEFIQPMDMEKTVDGITMRVEYVIVDQRQLNIFYTLDAPAYAYLNSWRPSVLSGDGTHLPVAISFGAPVNEAGALRQVVVDFFDQPVPDHLVFEMLVHPMEGTWWEAVARPASEPAEWLHTEPDPLVHFSFSLQLDPTFTAQGETIVLDQEFIMDDQRLTLTSVEVYPTHMRVNLSADPGNTAWLRSLRFFVENDRGDRFDAITNGISAFGGADSPNMVSHVLHSPFFAESEGLTLFIEAVEWLDKDMARVPVNLAEGTADRLPEGVTLAEARRDGMSWHLSFAVVERSENHNHQVFGQNYFNEAGDEFMFNAWSTGIRADGLAGDEANVFYVQFTLVDFSYEVVYLSPAFSRVVALDVPVVFELCR
ncbi:MAG: DUF4179 domain-containing protein [Defluviitaleaceae bacterium]|nr:DUF4179 domain-containing protein [Defluviitaleaceae bacterium]